MIRSQQVDSHHANFAIPDDVFEALSSDLDDIVDVLRCQESVYLSLQTNRTSNKPGSVNSRTEGQPSPNEILDTQSDETIARSLQEMVDDFEHISVSESAGSGPRNTGTSSPSTSLVAIHRDDINTDNMTYEELTSLVETIGTESRGLPQAIISNLPSKKYKGKAGLFSLQKERDQCVICMEDLRKGEWATTLLCSHQYHTGCIKRWFSDQRTCPICNRDMS